LAQQVPEPLDEAAEVVAGGGEDGVVGVAVPEPEIVAAHAVLGFEMADDGLHGGPSAQFALDLRRYPRFWPEMKTLTLWSGGALWPRYPLSAKMRWAAIALAAHLELTGLATAVRPAVVRQPPVAPLLKGEQERDAALDRAPPLG
jgi:hypothetical protein